MKNMKKLLAVLVAVLMIAISMSAMAATPEGLTADSSITISGLDDGDTVNLYKVIEWDEGTAERRAGWVLTNDFKNDAACQAVLHAINAVTDGVYSLTKEDVKAFTDVINAGGCTKTTGGTVANGASTTDVAPGMYVALVKPAKPDTMYNPIVVSADYKADNNTSEINAKQATVGGNSGLAKKETTKVEKEQDDPTDTTDNSVDVGDTVSFTVKTTIPTFADVYTTPSFVVTDTLSANLKLTTGTIKVFEEDGTTPIATLTSAVTEDSTTKWTLTVPTNYITGLATPKPIVIKYDAVLTSSGDQTPGEETNDVTVEFSNNPDNSQDKGKLKDETRTYTFSIDGKLLGAGGELTSELIKVAVDGNGDPIMQSKASGKTFKNALAGAKFGLYKTEADAEADRNYYTNGEFNGTVITDDDGYMKITGLDAGTYYLKEISAPDGFIKDQKTHKIVIDATYTTQTISEAGYPDYTVDILKSYSITIDDVATSTYNMTLTSDIAISEANVLPSSIPNTKGVELPSTGGMGTTLFYIGGAVLVLGAVVVMITRRRVRG